MTQARHYDDPCGVARALDAIGDRWALLVIRELVFGPKRFVQLRAGLRGVSQNVLSQRLRDLEAAGIVARDVLDPPASVAVYELTDRGKALEPVLVELGRWGSQQPLATSNELSPDALMLALKTAFRPVAATDATYAIEIAGEWFTVVVTGRSIEISRGRPAAPDVTLQADMATMRAVVFGREPIADAERGGRLKVRGDRELADRFTRLFPVPPRPSLRLVR